jgi:2'-5' RNA ligase
MHGVVSLLDDEHYRLIEEVWEELAEKFGVRAGYATPFPHFTYQVSDSYDAKAVESALHRLAAETAPFVVRTAGLGIFTAKRPVLYVPVVRSPALERLHEEVWRALGPQAAGEAARYYGPEMWMPHVTLAQSDIDCVRLAEIVCALATRNFHWEMEVNNLSYIYDTGTEQGLRCRFNFADGRKETHEQ